MSWIQKLYETHAAIPPDEASVPESHITVKAHIEVVLDAKGNFKRAKVIDKSDSTTVIPCTEESGAKAGIKPKTHPLCDRLQYLAGDFRDFGGEVTSGFKNIPGEPYESYVAQLRTWVEASPHEFTKAILAYVSSGCLIADLVRPEFRLLPLAEGKFVKKKSKGDEDRFPIWSVLATGQLPENAVVRWRVEIPGQPASGTWEDQSLIDNWSAYYPQAITLKDTCMVSGDNASLASLHPAKLRHAGDKAKLISANDKSGFTFRGRFTDPDGQQACGVGYEVTQKAHSALRWLISRQGFRNGTQVFVTWAVSGKRIPPPLVESSDWMDEVSTAFSEEDSCGGGAAIDHSRDVGQGFAQRLNRYMAGYRAQIDPTEDIVVMGLDSATLGRMSITYYRELLGSEFLARLENWYSTMAWPQRLAGEEKPKGKGKTKRRISWQTCAPGPRNIAETAYCRRLDDKLRRTTVERLLPCIIDGRELPRDLIESCVRRAANRVGMEHWEWEQALGVACAMFKGYHSRHGNIDERRMYEMTLEKERDTRDYLFGRLLAIAERIEEMALYVAGESRPTTAARLMQRFADHPCSTWRTIRLALQPYIQRLQSTRGGFLHNMQRLLDEVTCLFRSGDFESDRALAGEFLLGYHCQRQVWTKDRDNKIETEGEKE